MGNVKRLLNESAIQAIKNKWRDKSLEIRVRARTSEPTIKHIVLMVADKIDEFVADLETLSNE